MNIGGTLDCSLIDWDGMPCAVIWVRGCNFRCPWCHNRNLVVDMEDAYVPPLGLDRDPLIEGLCITGGEPCMQRELVQFCEAYKRETGKKIKLDTNGKFPRELKYLIDNKLVDYIAMDIKAPLTEEKYTKAVGIPIYLAELADIQYSIDLIRSSGLDYEFRTTVVPTFHVPKDIEQIAKYAIKGAKKYVIQNFKTCDSLINNSLASLKPFTLAELEEFTAAARPHVQKVLIRNQNT